MFKIQFSNVWNDYREAMPCDWDVLECVITHQEGHIAKATLTVGNFTPPLFAYLGVFEDDILLFQGMISGQFTHLKERTKVEILGLSPSFDPDMKVLLKSADLDIEPLFFKGLKPSDYLEADTKLLYWDRVSGSVSMSDYFKGKRVVDVGGSALKNSFKQHQMMMPLGKVIIDLKVEWTQSLEGLFDAAPYIARAFPEKMVATLAPQSLIDHWPLNDQRLGSGGKQSGYRVEYAKITRLVDNLGRPTHTQQFMQKREKPGEQGIQYPARAAIQYFKTILKIHWHYHQPRLEHLVLEGVLNHKLHRFTNHRMRRIPIHVQLPDRPQAMFFETPQGQRFIHYASKLVRTQLLASSRCTQVLCTLPWSVGRDLTLDDSLRVTSPLGESIIGKITMLNLVVKGLDRYVEVKLGCVIEPGDLKEEPLAESTSGYGEEGWPGVSSKDPLQGIVFEKLFARNLIKEITINNCASAQEALLLQNQYPLRDHLGQLLLENPTTIVLKLQDLRTSKNLNRRFNATLPLISPPKQKGFDR